jgi:protein TonB
MDANQLLTASALDIIFEGRNKEYGAYCLRKYYNRRLNIAMISTGLVVTIFILVVSFKKPASEIIPPVINGDRELVNIEPVQEKPQIIEPPKPVSPPPPVASIKFTTPPVIVDDKHVSPTDAPPPIDEALNAKIDVFTRTGPAEDPGFMPPQGTSTGVVSGLAEFKKADDSIFRKVEIESTYPGGPTAWMRFLNKNFSYPQEAADNRIQGTVRVQFIVDITGEISDVKALGGPPELIPEAIRVIKKSGKWSPAIQNGRTVKSYKQQPISFKLVDE